MLGDVVNRPWVGDLPLGWDVAQLKYLSHIRYGLSQPPGEDPAGLPFIRATDVSRGKINLATLKYVDLGEAPPGREARLRAGEIIVVRSGAYTGDSAIVPEPLAGSVIGYDMVVRPRRKLVEPHFVAWALLSPEALNAQIFLCRARAAQPHLNAEELGSTVLPLPPLPIQKAIATFLDRETAKIDALIDKKQRLIELLQEKRTALITQAVTQGLDPDVERKDSGVEWLGEIPAHWDVTRLGRIATLGNGSTPNRAERDFWEDGTIPWITSTKIHDERITAASQFVTLAALRRCHLPLVDEGSVMVGIIGQGPTRGKAAMLECKASLSQNLAYITPRPNVPLESEFLLRFFQAQYRWLRGESSGSGTAQAALNCSALAELRVPLPPSEEQSQIAEAISKADLVLSKLESKIHAARKLLQEYRTALISAAVTGKIDVREAA